MYTTIPSYIHAHNYTFAMYVYTTPPFLSSICTRVHVYNYTIATARTLLEIGGQAAGWRRCMGCLKLQVTFRKRATNYRAVLRKTTCENQALYGSLPLCSLVNSLRD